jgi:hypothetical protein
MSQDNEHGSSNASQVHAYLSALPTPAVGRDLFQRIEGTRQRRQVRRRLFAGSVALLAFCALLLTLPTSPGPVVEALVIQPTPATQAAGAQLRAIDRQLQAAYDRGADEAQLAALWRARELAVNRDIKESEHETIISL